MRPDVSHIGLAVDTGDGGSCRRPPLGGRTRLVIIINDCGVDWCRGMLGGMQFIRGPMMRAASYMSMPLMSTFAKLVPNHLSTASVPVFRPTTVQRGSLLPVASPVTLQAVEYKVKAMLKRRCRACRFVRRGHRLFIECTEKPRHKQMQKLSKQQLFRED